MARMIPEDFVAEVTQRLDIADVVGAYVNLRKQGRNLIGLCPFHNEKTPSFSVSQEKQIFYCFGCHKGGNALKFLMAIEGLTFPEAVEKAAAMVGLEIPQEQISPQENAAMQRRKRYFKLMAEAAAWYQQCLWQKGPNAKSYLQSRGLNAELTKSFQLGYADGWDGSVRYLLNKGYELTEIEEAGLASTGGKNGFFDKFHHRLIFPIVDYRGQVVAFGGRIIGDGQPKYLNSPETKYFHKSQNLYGLFQAAPSVRRNDEAVLMEGYMDVLTAHQFGVDNAVASLGTAFNDEHAKLLKRYTTKVLLVYDGDAAGLNAADRAIDILHNNGFAVRLLTLPEGLDPDDFLKRFGKPGWDKLVQEQAADFWQYRLNKALRAQDTSVVTGKVAVMQELKPYLNSCDDAVELESVIALLGKAIGVAPETIYSELRPKKPVQALQKKALRPQSGELRTQNAGQAAPIDRKQANLLLFMLYDKDIFEKVLTELGENFVESPPLQELLCLVQNIKSKYNWQPASLFSYLEEGTAYQLLLRMVQVDLSNSDLPGLAAGCVNAIKIERLQHQVENKRCQLAEQTVLDGGNTKELLREIADLEKQIRALRSIS